LICCPMCIKKRGICSTCWPKVSTPIYQQVIPRQNKLAFR